MQKKWWQNAIVYQIYPKSFLDSNGDGIGDLPGILQKLDYLAALGVNVVWLSPVFASPMADNGYDISDYRKIDPVFGTNADMYRLIEEADRRGIKILMDLVVNHTSDQHAWFQDAVKHPSGKYADYYIFEETENGLPPNNLRGYFTAPAWTRIPGTNRWYFHAFSAGQPDLNWENPELRAEIADMVNWWLDKGLGGFRIDAISNIKKSPRVRQHRPFAADSPDGTAFARPWIVNQPGIVAYLDELAARTFRPHDSMTVAEADLPASLLQRFVGEGGPFSMAFDFTYADIDVRGRPLFEKPAFTLDELRKAVFQSQLCTQKVGGWAAPFLENHDQPRALNKYIPSEDVGYASATMLAVLLLTLRGTPFIFQGEELGMTNCPMSLEEYNDTAVRTEYADGLRRGFSPEWMLAYFHRRSRDNSRTPFQWSAGANAGFTAGAPWLKINPNYTQVNAERQEADGHSVLKTYRRLIALRKESSVSDILTFGTFAPAACEGSLIVYRRVLEKRAVRIILNFGGTRAVYELPARAERVFSNLESTVQNGNRLELLPYQAVLLAEQS